MARLMLSAGMFSALAAATAVRSRGFFSGSPPLFAAMLISLIRRVKILPRLASSAPFLCLIVAHLEWPDITRPRKLDDYRMPIAPLCGHRETPASELARTCWAKIDYSIGCNELNAWWSCVYSALGERTRHFAMRLRQHEKARL